MTSLRSDPRLVRLLEQRWPVARTIASGPPSVEQAIERVPLARLALDKRFASALPPSSNLEGIRESIRLHGILIPLIATDDWFLLDGHTRLGIARELELDLVPVLRLPVSSGSGWARSFALALGLDRRHLTLGQRVLLGTSLLKVENALGRERMGDARRMRKGKKSESQGNGSPGLEDGEDRASARIAIRLGLSRKTFDRVRTVIEHAPQDVREQLLLGRISVSSAYQKLRRVEIAARAAREIAVLDAGIYREVAAAPSARYRTIYADPPWPYDDDTAPGSAANHYPGLSLDQLAALDVARLAHPEGCHLWLWTTWPKIRDGAPRLLVARWGFRWVGEVCWTKDRPGAGRWIRSGVEVCVLAVRGNLPLLRDDVPAHIRAPRRGHSVKPPEMRALVESASPGPRIELFARDVAEGWDGFGNEARRA